MQLEGLVVDDPAVELYCDHESAHGQFYRFYPFKTEKRKVGFLVRNELC